MKRFLRSRDPVAPENRRWAVLMLQNKALQLGRVPNKADFEEQERMKIKTFLGPWPRALEEAGLKAKKSANTYGDGL